MGLIPKITLQVWVCIPKGREAEGERVVSDVVSVLGEHGGGATVVPCSGVWIDPRTDDVVTDDVRRVETDLCATSFTLDAVEALADDVADHVKERLEESAVYVRYFAAVGGSL